MSILTKINPNNKAKNSAKNSVKNSKLVSYKPTTFSEAKEIAKEVKKGNAVLIDFTNTPDQISLRIVDFISGYLSAIDGEYKRISSKTFLVSMSAEIAEKYKNRIR